MEETIQIAWKEVILLELAKGNPKLKEVVLCRRGGAAGITRQHYNLIEAGKRRPSVEVAKAIAVVLGFDWTRFYTDECPLERDTGQDSA